MFFFLLFFFWERMGWGLGNYDWYMKKSKGTIQRKQGTTESAELWYMDGEK